MTREIKFRGKTLSGGFVYGDLLHYTNPHEGDKVNNGCIIVTEYKSDKDNSFKIVDPETVGQFTGLLDKDGKEIYEGDIVRNKEVGGYGFEYIGVVRYYEEDCRFGIDLTATNKFTKRKLFTIGECSFNDGHCTITYYNEYEVLGNIHENHELLKAETP